MYHSSNAYERIKKKRKFNSRQKWKQNQIQKMGNNLKNKEI